MKLNSAKYFIIAAWILLSCVSGCKKEAPKVVPDEINDYLPLKIGAKYMYIYSYSYTYVFDNSQAIGECTWKFFSKTSDSTVVYQVEQSFTGYNIHEYYVPPRKDTTHFENRISTLSFEVQNEGKVVCNLIDGLTFERFIQSDRNDTCFRKFSSGVCLRKNVGITSLFSNSFGNHSESFGYYLIEGPYY